MENRNRKILEERKKRWEIIDNMYSEELLYTSDLPTELTSGRISKTNTKKKGKKENQKKSKDSKIVIEDVENFQKIARFWG